MPKAPVYRWNKEIEIAISAAASLTVPKTEDGLGKTLSTVDIDNFSWMAFV
jgi:hypothetical protein